MGAMFKPQLPAEWGVVLVDTLGRRMNFLSNKLEGKTWLMGERCICYLRISRDAQAK
jgi:hypothetical protein